MSVGCFLTAKYLIDTRAVKIFNEYSILSYKFKM